MIHPTSTFLNTSLSHIERFKAVPARIIDDNVKSTVGKITIYSTKTKTNYGLLIYELPNILPHVYITSHDEESAMVTNTNKGNLSWYIDGSDVFTLKENLPGVSTYAITHKSQKSGLWISKPSHPYIGSGKFIQIGSKTEVVNRKNEFFRGEKLRWVVQPLLTNILLWHDTYKFDLRLYAAIFNIGDTFHAACYNIGIGRRCVNPHNPKIDPNSAITNISVQESLHGYDAEFNIPLVYDDSKIGATLVKDFLNNTPLKRDHRKKSQILILGLDVIFMKDGTPYLIEVNHGPSLEFKENNNERVASLGFILGLYGYIIPHLIGNTAIHALEDWEIFSQ